MARQWYYERVRTGGDDELVIGQNIAGVGRNRLRFSVDSDDLFAKARDDTVCLVPLRGVCDDLVK